MKHLFFTLCLIISAFNSYADKINEVQQKFVDPEFCRVACSEFKGQPTIDNMYQALSPNGDGIQDWLTIEFTNAVWYEFNVLTNAGHIVYTKYGSVDESLGGTSSLAYVWNGILDNGKRVNDGYHTYIITAWNCENDVIDASWVHVKANTNPTPLPTSPNPIKVFYPDFYHDMYETQNISNGWDQIYSNEASGWIGGWHLSPNNKFYPGDFNGDGQEEVLIYSGGDWLKIMTYNNRQWSTMWHNSGDKNHKLIPYGNNILVGDFDGDGKDDILGMGSTYTTMYSFEDNKWVWKSSNFGEPTALTPYRDNLIVGDFDGDGKDELFGTGKNGGWKTMFNYSNQKWNWGWSDFGKNVTAPNTDNAYAIDLDGDGDDEIIGLNGWATTYNFKNGKWDWKWSTEGGKSFAGWTYPLKNDVVLVGNIDTDPNQELMFIAGESNSRWSSTFDFDNFAPNRNWSNNGGLGQIDDWSIAHNNNKTQYFLMKSSGRYPSYLVAIRHYKCAPELAKVYRIDGFYNNMKKGLNSVKDIEAVLTLYPNPTSRELNIQSSTELGQSQIIITNQLGSQVLTSTIDINGFNTNTINVETLTPGMYICTIVSNGNKIVKKFIKN